MVRSLTGFVLRRVLDCITSPESAATCFSAIARTGGRYACLEALDDTWRTRRLIRVKEVMGYEGLGRSAALGSAGSTYSRKANPALYALCQQWRDEVQGLLDTRMIQHHPMREIYGTWDGILEGLEMLKRGEVKGQKLVVRITSHAAIN